MAAKSKSTASVIKFQPKPKVKRKGIVAKTKSSKIKGSKLYRKRNVGQG
jgi:hypothetical protein